MKELHIDVQVQFFALEELPKADIELIERAKEMTSTSYSPYSHFCVGAALLLEDGQMFTGSNQENAVFPVGLCAERTTFFAAAANAPSIPPVALAIAGRLEGESGRGAFRRQMVQAVRHGDMEHRVVAGQFPQASRIEFPQHGP